MSKRRIIIFAMNYLGIFIFFSQVIAKCPEQSSKATSRILLKTEKSHKVDPDSDKVTTTMRPRKKCCPYDFDSKICNVVDDKVLCGFDKNKGSPYSYSKTKDLSNGCRFRGGRLECGYLQAPYTNFRRPPAWDWTPKYSSESDSGEKSKKGKTEQTNGEYDSEYYDEHDDDDESSEKKGNDEIHRVKNRDKVHSLKHEEKKKRKKFNYAVLAVFDCCALARRVVFAERALPWITFTVREMMKLRDKAHKRYRSTGLDKHGQYYKELKKCVSTAINKEKCVYFTQRINRNISNSVALWNNLKRTIKISDKSRNVEIPDYLCDPI